VSFDREGPQHFEIYSVAYEQLDHVGHSGATVILSNAHMARSQY
jgi:hypothetical protein